LDLPSLRRFFTNFKDPARKTRLLMSGASYRQDTTHVSIVHTSVAFVKKNPRRFGRDLTQPAADAPFAFRIISFKDPLFLEE